VVVSEAGEVGFGAVPVQIIFCLKEFAACLQALALLTVLQEEPEEAE
jgi:hypothetical protein